METRLQDIVGRVSSGPFSTQAHVSRERRVKFWIMNRIVNPLVKLILRSPAHSLLSGSLVLLTYRGLRSGRFHSLPVMYVRRNNDLFVFAAQPRDKKWWRNLHAPAAVELVLYGRRLRARAQVILSDHSAISLAWAAYLAKFPKAAAASAANEPVFVKIELTGELCPKGQA
jgi:hypothetical protein